MRLVDQINQNDEHLRKYEISKCISYQHSLPLPKPFGSPCIMEHEFTNASTRKICNVAGGKATYMLCPQPKDRKDVACKTYHFLVNKILDERILTKYFII